MPNRLASEKSPYLLQHANNPVDWYPWGDEAFDYARREDRPIFLSVGYSTCHWCHVMEHESFENDDIARVLNRDFVCIKVDREERPDVDRVYMLFVQATTGSGGWPMSVWLTPELKPFYGGTYFPPDSRYGRPGFQSMLGEIARAWRDERTKVERSAEALVERLRAMAPPERQVDVPGVSALARAVRAFETAFDRHRGGFGSAPKFPRPTELLFLMREFARTGNQSARDMALRTLQAMASGGMRDHIGGGFHRYSVDADWRVPHFEKMLYDQAQLVLTFLEAAQATGDRMYADVADDTLRYIVRDLTDREGGFYSAEDADSVPPEQAGLHGAHKSEGAFYLWTHAEVGEILGPDADLVRARFGIEPSGNAPFDPQAEFTGKNLIYLARSSTELGDQFTLAPADVHVRLEAARTAMSAVRGRRLRPQLDDKILAAWNGLMIAAFARASRVLAARGASPSAFDRRCIPSGCVAPPSITPGILGRRALPAGRIPGLGATTHLQHGPLESVDHLHQARRAARFMHERLWDSSSRTLSRRCREGEVAIAGYAEDYACAIWGALELFQADGEPAWLEWALDLQRRQDELFWDEQGSGWFSTTGTDPSVLLRMKEDYDGAEPSATSVSVGNLLLLAHLTGEARWRDRIDRTLAAWAERLTSMGRGVPLMLANLSAWHAGIQQIVLVGRRDDPSFWKLSTVVAHTYLPFAVTLLVEPGPQQERLSAVVPAIAAMCMRDGKPTAYVCRDFACQQPTTDAAELAAQL